MKQSLLFMFIFSHFLFPSCHCWAQSYSWAYQTVQSPTPNGSDSYGTHVITLEDGYLFGGSFSGKIALENDTLIDNQRMPLVYPYEPDLLLFKTDKNGKVKWHHQLGGQTYGEFISDLHVGKDGYIYVIGQLIKPVIKLDGDTLPVPTIPYYGFFAKFDQKGVLQFIQYPGYLLNSITSDHEGNFYLTGRYISTDGALVEKRDPHGDIIWRMAGKPGDPKHPYNVVSEGYDIAVNKDKEVFITGKLSNDGISASLFSFDTILVSSSSVQGFVAKLDSNGRFKWVVNEFQTINKIEYAGGEDFFLSGMYIGTLKNDLITVNESNYDKRGYLLRLNGKTKTISSFTKIESPALATIGDLRIGNKGTAYVAGTFSNSLTFGSASMTTASTTSLCFVASYNGKASGYALSQHPLGGFSSEFQISPDTVLGSLVMTGRFHGSPQFGLFSLYAPDNGSEFAYLSFTPANPIVTEIIQEKSSSGEGTLWYTNPVNNVISLQSLEAIEDVELWNCQGEQFSIQVLSKNEKSWELGVSTLTPGMYLLKTSTSKGSYTGKLIKR